MWNPKPCPVAEEEADEGEEEKEEEEEEELTRLGPQLLVWAHNPGLEMFKFCPVWAYNSLSGRYVHRLHPPRVFKGEVFLRN